MGIKRSFPVAHCTFAVACTIVIAFGAWRDQPRRTANQFQAFVETAQFAAADGMFNDAGEAIIAALMSDARTSISVELPHQTFNQWLRGVYPVSVVLHRPGGFGDSGGDSFVLCIASDATGVRQFCPANDLKMAQRFFAEYL